MEAGGGHVCSVYANILDCWGSDSQGQVSIPANVKNEFFDDVKIIVSMVTGTVHTCVLVVYTQTDGIIQSISCWGGIFEGYHRKFYNNGLNNDINIDNHIYKNKDDDISINVARSRSGGMPMILSAG